MFKTKFRVQNKFKYLALVTALNKDPEQRVCTRTSQRRVGAPAAAVAAQPGQAWMESAAPTSVHQNPPTPGIMDNAIQDHQKDIYNDLFRSPPATA